MKRLFHSIPGSILGLLIGAVSAIAQTGEWTVVPTVPSGKLLTAIASPSASAFIAVGNHGRILRSADGGNTWTDLPSGLPDTWESNLVDLSFGSSRTGTAVGGTGNILHTTDGGAGWTKGDAGIQTYMTGVCFLDENFGIVTSLPLLKTRDGGLTWELMVFSQEASIKDFVFMDTLRGFAVGPAGFAGSGSIFRTEDGGVTWSFVFVDGVGFGQFHQIAFVDDQHGLIVGSSGTVLRTEDGGETWSLVDSGVPVELFAVAMHDPMNAVAVGAEGTIIRTTDGGSTWQEEISPTDEVLRGVSIDENGTAVAVGGNDAGVIVRRESIPTGVVESTTAENGKLLAIAPNPVMEEMRIEWRTGNEMKEAGEGDIVIRDLLGKEIERFPVRIENGGATRNVEHLSSGVYFVTLTFEEKEVTTKIWVGGR